MKYRVYYNRSEDHPVLWCVDEGTIKSQIRVQFVRFCGVEAYTQNHKDSPNGNKNQNEPHGWLQIDNCKLAISFGEARFYPS